MRIQIENDRLIFIKEARDRAEWVSYQQNMLKVVKWLLPYEWEKEGRLIYFQGRGMSFSDWLTRDPEAEDLKAFLVTMLDLCSDLENHLLDEDRLFFQPGWLWWEPEEQCIQAVYCPWLRQESKTGFSIFFRRLLRMMMLRAVEDNWNQEKRDLLFLFARQISGTNRDSSALAAVRKDAPYPVSPDSRANDKEKEVSDKRLGKGPEGSPAARPIDPEKEKALDALIAAQMEKEEPVKTFFKRLKSGFPIAIKD